MPLIFLSCAWVAGIYLGSRFNPPLVLILIGLIPLPLLFFHKQRKPIILSSLCIIALFAGALCFQSSLPPDNENSLHFYNNETVTIRGMVDRDQEVGEKTAQIRLSATGIEIANGWQEVSGDVLLFVPRYSTYKYGDMLEVTGKLEAPPQFDDFDYAGYLEHQGIRSTMLYPKIEILERGKGSKATGMGLLTQKPALSNAN